MLVEMLNRKKVVLSFILITIIIFNYPSKEFTDRSGEMREPIIVEFPLKGEWHSPNTPETKIPSHGTDRLGTRYAYDFIQVDWDRSGWPSYRGSLLKYLMHGISISDYYCWGQEIYSPCDGVVIRAEDGYAERGRTNLFLDFFNANRIATYFDPKSYDVQSIAGNFIIIQMEESVYVALCHLKKDSVRVIVGQSFKKSDVIGNVGHSGNSFGPHLHFQLMNSSDIATANGLPCAFEKYEVFRAGRWKEVVNGIPTATDRIRKRGDLK